MEVAAVTLPAAVLAVAVAEALVEGASLSRAGDEVLEFRLVCVNFGILVEFVCTAKPVQWAAMPI
ncbi:hypothetical protein Nos7524_1247 [Nostoc sp. PCC 7524]|uniref:hypothetical protein n=1 Tax=Nostoc sp. (strain ATCC 29411 / PCC 7524) TaxID=28072 RepID=UPI00029EFEB3|nr:hypothetical protein [Nostoc sp. PCC 7524]AFY47131.1 hypothetical protein Nos7524_1247 [Nostoc sp. PCC 7524]